MLRLCLGAETEAFVIMGLTQLTWLSVNVDDELAYTIWQFGRKSDLNFKRFCLVELRIWLLNSVACNIKLSPGLSIHYNFGDVQNFIIIY